MLPNPDILNDYEHGKFVLSNLAAKRAKQLQEGALPLVQVESNHPLTIALAEIAAGKIKAIMPSLTAAVEMETPSIFVEELPSELGLLLPALDETEAALVGSVLGEDDHDIDHDHHEAEDGEVSLSDLVGDEEEEDVAPAPADDDTLSLSDIADQEDALEDAEPEE